MKTLKPSVPTLQQPYDGMVTTELEISAIDIPTMRGMKLSEYRAYLDGSLLFVDHHDVLRSAIADYPLAVTVAQLDALIDHLSSLRPRFVQADC